MLRTENSVCYAFILYATYYFLFNFQNYYLFHKLKLKYFLFYFFVILIFWNSLDLFCLPVLKKKTFIIYYLFVNTSHLVVSKCLY